jgi:hypothetical protein
MSRPLQLDLLLLLHEVLDQQPQLLLKEACRHASSSCWQPLQEAACSDIARDACCNDEQEQDADDAEALETAAAGMAATATGANIRLDLRQISGCHAPFAEFFKT